MYTKNFPLMTKLISDKRISKPWVANELFKCIKQRSSNFKLLKLGLMDAQIYNSYRNYVTKKIRNSEKSYYLNTFENSRNNPRQTWLTIKEILGHKKVSSDMKLVEDGREICDAREIAQIFNNYFVTVGPNLANEIPVSNTSPLSFVSPNQNSFFSKTR